MGDHRLSGAERSAFSKRLQSAIEQSGLTYEEIAKRARGELPESARLSSGSIWQYANGKTFPRQRSYISAIGKALGVSVEDLLAAAGPDDPTPEFRPQPRVESQVRVEDLRNGRAKLYIVTDVPWPTALKILSLVTEEEKNLAAE